MTRVEITEQFHRLAVSCNIVLATTSVDYMVFAGCSTVCHGLVLRVECLLCQRAACFAVPSGLNIPYAYDPSFGCCCMLFYLLRSRLWQLGVHLVY